MSTTDDDSVDLLDFADGLVRGYARRDAPHVAFPLTARVDDLVVDPRGAGPDFTADHARLLAVSVTLVAARAGLPSIKSGRARDRDDIARWLDANHGRRCLLDATRWLGKHPHDRAAKAMLRAAIDRSFARERTAA